MADTTQLTAKLLGQLREAFYSGKEVSDKAQELAAKLQDIPDNATSVGGEALGGRETWLTSWSPTTASYVMKRSNYVDYDNVENASESYVFQGTNLTGSNAAAPSLAAKLSYKYTISGLVNYPLGYNDERGSSAISADISYDLQSAQRITINAYLITNTLDQRSSGRDVQRYELYDKYSVFSSSVSFRGRQEYSGGSLVDAKFYSFKSSFSEVQWDFAFDERDSYFGRLSLTSGAGLDYTFGSGNPPSFAGGISTLEFAYKHQYSHFYSRGQVEYLYRYVNGSGVADDFDLAKLQAVWNGAALDVLRQELFRGNDLVYVTYEEFPGDGIYVGDGNDRVYGGKSIDRIYGESGDDLISGGAGYDILDGGVGNDKILGGSGSDELFGHEGDDYLDGGTAADRVYGGGGNDILKGGAGNDLIYGESGDDRLEGGSGNDLLGGAPVRIF